MEAICLRRQIATCSEVDSWQKFPAPPRVEYKSCNWIPSRNPKRVPSEHSLRVRNVARPLWSLAEGNALPLTEMGQWEQLPWDKINFHQVGTCAQLVSLSAAIHNCGCYTQTGLKPCLRTPERLG